MLPHPDPVRPGRAGLMAVILAAGMVIAGCGGPGDPGPGEGSSSPVDGQPARSAALFDPGRIYRDSIGGVVSVRTVYYQPGLLGARGASGSGFVLSRDGEVITNAHVISQETGDGWKPAGRIFVEFSTGDVLPARVVGTDPFSDVGLLRVDPAHVKMMPLPLGDSEKVTVGEPVAVIGSPFGEDQTLTTGVVSQVGRSVKSLTDFEIQDAIQTDASINPGNSGGPMLDSDGKLITISQQMTTGSGASDGVGFGVPVNAIRRSAEQIRDRGEVSYAYIGLTTEPLYPQLAEKLGLPVKSGAMVSAVIPGGPADGSGLRAGGRDFDFQGDRFVTGGDVIVKAAGTRVEDPTDLGRAISRQEPGDRIPIEVVRDGQIRTVEVELGRRPERITRR